MLNFKLGKTPIFQAVLWKRNPFFGYAGFLKKIFLLLYLISLFIFLYGFVPSNFTESLNRKILGSTLIFLVLTILAWLKELFFLAMLKHPSLSASLEKVVENPYGFNLAEFMSFEAAYAFFESQKYSRSKKLPYIDSSLLFYFLLRNNPELNFVFYRGLVDADQVRKILKNNLKTLNQISNNSLIDKAVNHGTTAELDPELEQVILEALKVAHRKGHCRISCGDILTGLAFTDPVFKKIMLNADLKAEDIENISDWLEQIQEKRRRLSKFWEMNNLLKFGSLGREWSSGYTVTLDKFSTDLTLQCQIQGFPEIIGHQDSIEEMERILSREEDNNVLLIGEPGSGRKSIVQAFVEKGALGQSLPGLNYKRILRLDVAGLISRADTVKSSGDLLEIIFSEAVSAGNVILMIDEFHNFVGGPSRPGVMDLSGVIASYLNMPQFQIIAVTTYQGLHKYIEENPALLNLFEKVEVSEISRRDILTVLENMAVRLELKYGKFVSYQALRDIISYCEKYLQDTPFPEKAIELLDEIMVYVTQKKEKMVLPKQVAKVFSDKTDIPVGEVEKKEKEILLNLEELFHRRIVNQEEAIKEVSNALRRARSEINIRKAPMGSFLFLGPTGVGKTETSKSLAAIYFGSEERTIRLDMSEFQDVADIPRLIGSTGEEGLLTTKVRENPFSLILLDEIEKAHPNILNLFLQVLDEGHITDGLGRKVDFKNTIIIATSNAGYLIILEALKHKRNMDEVKEKLFDYLFKEGIFRPEFINRFDAVVLFKALTRENLLDISELLLRKVRKNLIRKEINLLVTPELKGKIVDLSYNPKFGAREMSRVIQDKVGNALAKALLSNKVKKGDTIKINPETFELTINP